MKLLLLLYTLFIQMLFYSDNVILETLYWHLQAWSFYTQLKIVYWPNLLQMHLYSYNVNKVLTSASEAGIITVIAVVYTNSSVRTVYQLRFTSTTAEVIKINTTISSAKRGISVGGSTCKEYNRSLKFNLACQVSVLYV